MQIIELNLVVMCLWHPSYLAILWVPSEIDLMPVDCVKTITVNLFPDAPLSKL